MSDRGSSAGLPPLGARCWQADALGVRFDYSFPIPECGPPTGPAALPGIHSRISILFRLLRDAHLFPHQLARAFGAEDTSNQKRPQSPCVSWGLVRPRLPAGIGLCLSLVRGLYLEVAKLKYAGKDHPLGIRSGRVLRIR